MKTLALVAAMASASTFAAVPNTFHSGDVITAQSMNENFEYLDSKNQTAGQDSQDELLYFNTNEQECNYREWRETTQQESPVKSDPLKSDYVDTTIKSFSHEWNIRGVGKAVLTYDNFRLHENAVINGYPSQVDYYATFKVDEDTGVTYLEMMPHVRIDLTDDLRVSINDNAMYGITMAGDYLTDRQVFDHMHQMIQEQVNCLSITKVK
ncbi:hypothetical protein [Vibrio breoganii]|uniref:hypothetical protein n=1 Tax=Vibrio breoganii TaxID=553239 RepID=UPI000C85A186|nr:hypothetical protein [Vibrio breoganii]PMK30637.1 hypothetical protein BCU03_09475 [Vibrio breoganii]